MTWSEPRSVPYHWWGDAWAKPNPASLDSLISSRMVSAEQAARLARAISNGKSVVVTGSESGIGKSTLAHALIPHLDTARRNVYVRGAFEQFLWLDQIEPSAVALLVNEISDDLPVYLHGQALATVAGLLHCGAQLLATSHPAGLSKLLNCLENGATPDLQLIVVTLSPDHSGQGAVSDIDLFNTSSLPHALPV